MKVGLWYTVWISDAVTGIGDCGYVYMKMEMHGVYANNITALVIIRMTQNGDCYEPGPRKLHIIAFNELISAVCPLPLWSIHGEDLVVAAAAAAAIIRLSPANAATSCCCWRNCWPAFVGTLRVTVPVFAVGYQYLWQRVTVSGWSTTGDDDSMVMQMRLVSTCTENSFTVHAATVIAIIVTVVVMGGRRRRHRCNVRDTASVRIYADRMLIFTVLALLTCASI